MSVLAATEQLKTHHFYQPSEGLTLKQFRDHLQAMRQDQPQLYPVNGKLYRRVKLAFAERTRRMQTGQKEQTRNGSRNKVQTRRGAPIVVHGIVRPKPDLNKLLRAMIEMAWDEQDKDDQSKS